MSALEKLVGALEAAGCKPKAGSARCPAHDDRVASLTYKQGARGAVCHCHAGCTPKAIMEALGLKLIDLFEDQPQRVSTNVVETQKDGSPGKVVAEYIYQDEDGKPLIKVIRYEPKTFRQARWDGHEWVWGLGDVRRVLYNLPAVIAAVAAGERVWIVEGEKDVETLRKLGLPGTCNLGGAGHGKWRSEYNRNLAGARVAIVPDDDPPGLAFADEIRRFLEGTTTDCQLVSLGGPKDVSEWYERGGCTREALEQLLRPARAYTTYSFGGFMELDLPPAEPIIDPIICAGDLVQVHAFRGLGKSLFLAQMALSIASGREFLKWTVRRPFRTMLVDGEMPLPEIQKRLLLLAYATDEGNEMLPAGEMFRLLPAMGEPNGVASLSTPEGQHKFEGHLVEADVFIFDHLSSLFRGGEENAAESWDQAQEWLLRLRSLGKTCIFAHHDNKLRQQRGTSKKEDVLSVSMHLTEIKDNETNGAHFRLAFDKHRSLFGKDIQGLEATLGFAGGTSMRREWTWRAAEEEVLEEIEEMLRGGMTERAIARELGISQKTVNRRAAGIRGRILAEKAENE
jgi:hypothetical protein